MDQQHLMDYLPIVLMFIIALGFVGATMVATHFLGPKRKTDVKLESFECGIEPQGNARVPFSIKYFLVAILFVLFDVEVIFMYPWAVLFKEQRLVGGMSAAFTWLIEMVIFIGFLLVGFFYILKRGALKWE